MENCSIGLIWVCGEGFRLLCLLVSCSSCFQSLVLRVSVIIDSIDASSVGPPSSVYRDNINMNTEYVCCSFSS